MGRANGGGGVLRSVSGLSVLLRQAQDERTFINSPHPSPSRASGRTEGVLRSVSGLSVLLGFPPLSFDKLRTNGILFPLPFEGLRTNGPSLIPPSFPFEGLRANGDVGVRWGEGNGLVVVSTSPCLITLLLCPVRPVRSPGVPSALLRQAQDEREGILPACPFSWGSLRSPSTSSGRTEGGPANGHGPMDYIHQPVSDYLVYAIALAAGVGEEHASTCYDHRHDGEDQRDDAQSAAS